MKVATLGQASGEDKLKYKMNVKNIADEEEEDDGESEGEYQDLDEDEMDDEEEAELDEEGEAEMSESLEGEGEDEDLNDPEEATASKNKYKAPKSNPVYFQDPSAKKDAQKETYQKKKAAKSEYLDELRREMYDEPEEVQMGGFSQKKSKF